MRKYDNFRYRGCPDMQWVKRLVCHHFWQEHVSIDAAWLQCDRCGARAQHTSMSWAAANLPRTSEQIQETASEHHKAHREDAEREIRTRPIAIAAEPFQARVVKWLMACFGPVIATDRQERGDRLLEELFELLQSGGYDPARILPLRDYVWASDIGEPHQEIGGVMVTLAAYCNAHDLDMQAAAEDEIARVWTKVEKIRAKQAAKPSGSALPMHFPLEQTPDWAALTKMLRGWADDHGDPNGTGYQQG